MIDSKIALRCFTDTKFAFMGRRGRLEVAGVAQDRQVGSRGESRSGNETR